MEKKSPHSAGFPLDVVNRWTPDKINPFISMHYTIIKDARRRLLGIVTEPEAISSLSPAYRNGP